jgi:hypothetical protein
MSWVEEINTGLAIRTGDGNEFRPKWLNVTILDEYNIAEFDFPEVEGTLVTRRKARGGKYNLEVYFDGEDYLEILSTFRTSSKDSRPWTVNHPFYGQIIVQPLSLQFDLSKYNSAQVTGTIMETITEGNPQVTADPKDLILSKADQVEFTYIASFTNGVSLSATDLITLTSNTDSMYEAAKGIAGSNEESEEYFNLYKAALSAIDEAVGEPENTITKMQAFMTAPGAFDVDVKRRVDTLAGQLDTLLLTVDNIVDKNGSKIFENNGGILLTAMCIAASSGTGLLSRLDVVYVMDIIFAYHNTYITNLDSIQSANNGNTTSYMPDHDSIFNLTDLVDFTITNLITVALSAKQERVLYLEEDSNVVTLTHRFYGIPEDDSTIDYFIKTNTIGRLELLNVRKGRRLVYYI